MTERTQDKDKRPVPATGGYTMDKSKKVPAKAAAKRLADEPQLGEQTKVLLSNPVVVEAMELLSNAGI